MEGLRGFRFANSIDGQGINTRKWISQNGHSMMISDGRADDDGGATYEGVG